MAQMFDVRKMRKDVRAEFIGDCQALACWYHWKERTLTFADEPSVIADAVRLLGRQGFTHDHTTTYHCIPPLARGGGDDDVPVFFVVLQHRADSARNPDVDPLGVVAGYSVRGSVLVLKQACFTCHGAAASLCQGCARAVYCSSACQRADWPRHRSDCGCAGNILHAPTRTVSESEFFCRI